MAAAAERLTPEEQANLREFRERAVREPLNARIRELEAVINKPNLIKEWITTYLYELFLYIPNALVLFGPILDTINEEFRYSLASIIGIGSVFVNWIFGKILSAILKPFSAVIALKCTVPGFENLESFFSPQGIVLPTSIFTYLLIDLGIHRSPSENIGTGILMIGFILIQSFVMYANKCLKGYYFSRSIITILLGILVGALCGFIGWIGVRLTAPQRLPTGGAVFSPNSNSLTKNPLTGGVTNNVATCAPPNDQDQFVCEEES